MADKAVVGVLDDMGEGMQCVDHPYRSNPGGVCAFCLQEKLGKLVSSSKSSPFLPLQPPPSSSSSSPASFRSDVGIGGGGLGLASGHCRGVAGGGGRRNKFNFLAASHTKKKKSGGGGGGGGYGGGGRKVSASVANGPSNATTSASVANDGGMILPRSKSVAARATGGLAQVGGDGRIVDAAIADSPRKKSFWSFLYHSSASSTSTSSSSAANNGSSNINRRRSTSSSAGGYDREGNKQQQPSASDKLAGKLEAATAAPRQVENGGEEAESPSGSHASSFGRKVARSRSVGCGSRSFSGDFLERISTGFGDCTLRRVESQREAKPKIVLHLDHDKNSDSEQQRPRMRERIKCGGLFGGFGMMSAYWLSAAAGDDDFDTSSRTSTAAAARGGSTHGRARSWGLAFASPMRAFRPYSSSSKSLYAINKATPAPNIISSINSSNKLVNGSIKESNPDGNASFMAAQS